MTKRMTPGNGGDGRIEADVSDLQYAASGLVVLVVSNARCTCIFWHKSTVNRQSSSTRVPRKERRDRREWCCQPGAFVPSETALGPSHPRSHQTRADTHQWAVTCLCVSGGADESRRGRRRGREQSKRAESGDRRGQEGPSFTQRKTFIALHSSERTVLETGRSPLTPRHPQLAPLRFISFLVFHSAKTRPHWLASHDDLRFLQCVVGMLVDLLPLQTYHCL
jgi:hypothetical protein